MKKYKHKCEYVGTGYSHHFKTKHDMKTHCSNCVFDYVTTKVKDEVESILVVFHKVERKLLLVCCKGFPGQDFWEKEHSLLQDGCTSTIKTFCSRSFLNPTLNYYPDPDPEPDGGQHHCCV